MLNRVNKVLVSNSESANTGTTLNTIALDDVLIFNNGFGTALTGTPVITGTDNDIIHLALGTGSGQSVLSNSIVVKNISKVVYKSYVAPATKTMTFGFDGTSGTIAAPASSTEYQMNILIKDDQRILSNRPTKQAYNYVTDSSATATELAIAFATKVQNDVKFNNTNSYVTAVVLTNGTFVALTNNASVTQYGKTITSTAHGLVAGDLVRIGGTAATTPVYQVDTVVSSSVFTIKGKYMGASATILAANILKMTVANTSVGIQLAARPINYDGIDLYQKINFDCSLFPTNGSGFTVLSTPVVTTEIAMGQGYWQQVRDVEYFAQGYDGITNRIQFTGSITNPLTRAVVDYKYNSYVIEHFAEGETSMQRTQAKPLTTEVYFYNVTPSGPSSTKQTDFNGILSSLLTSAGINITTGV